MIVTLNGERLQVATNATVATVIESLVVDPDARGVAVALDGEVVTRSRWSDTAVAEGSRIEVVAAIGGG